MDADLPQFIEYTLHQLAARSRGLRKLTREGQRLASAMTDAEFANWKSWYGDLAAYIGSPCPLATSAIDTFRAFVRITKREATN